jgi:hypothetical protein
MLNLVVASVSFVHVPAPIIHTPHAAGCDAAGAAGVVGDVFA